MSSTQSQTPAWRQDWVGLALVLLAAALVYGRALKFGVLPHWDDGLYILSRPEVRDWWAATWQQRLWTPRTGYPTPVPTFLVAQVRLLFPSNFIGVLHGLNLSLHLVNVALVFTLIRRWSWSRTALFVAALWALHPLNVEPVAWLTELKTLLAAMLILVAMNTWERHLAKIRAQPPDASDRHGLSPATGLILFGSFLLALGCRPDAGVLPVVLLVQAVRVLGWKRAVRRLRWIAGPMLVTWLVYLPVAKMGLAALEGAGPTTSDLPLARAAQILRGLEFAARHIALPFDLQPAYYIATHPDWIALIPGACLLAATLVLAWALWRRGTYEALFVLALTAVLYAPFANLVHHSRVMMDSYLYLIKVGPLYLIVTMVERTLAGAGSHQARGRRLIVGAVAAAFAVLGWTSYRQLDRWKSTVALWAPMIERYPSAWQPYALVGEALFDRKQYKQAARVLHDGLPVFRASHHFPDFMPVAVARSGHPQAALGVAAEALRPANHPKDEHFEVFLGLVVQLGVSPDTAALKPLVDRAIERFRRRDDFMNSSRNRLSIAMYLTRFHRYDDARVFLKREFASPSPHCAAWKLVHYFPANADRSWVPPRPKRCSSAAGATHQ